MRWIQVGLGAVLIALLITSAVLLLHAGPSTDPGMVVAAREEATNFFSLDYNRANADIDRVLALATGSFKTEYASKRDAILAGVAQKKLVVTSVIPQNGAAVEFVQGDRGQVLVAVDVTTGGSVQRYRTRVLLTRVDGHWLVSGLDQVG